MRGRWIAQRFEDRFSYGIPDVGFVMRKGGGWGFLELKRIPAWPKRESTPVAIPHKKHWQIQQAWAERIGRLTGRVFLLLQVERAYFIFTWQQMQEVGKLTANGLLVHAEACWANKMDYTELEVILGEKHGV